MCTTQSSDPWRCPPTVCHLNLNLSFDPDTAFAVLGCRGPGEDFGNVLAAASIIINVKFIVKQVDLARLPQIHPEKCVGCLFMCVAGRMPPFTLPYVGEQCLLTPVQIPFLGGAWSTLYGYLRWQNRRMCTHLLL